MQNQTLHYSRPLTMSFFAEATHDDLKWTINYLMGLLEIPEKKKDKAISIDTNNSEYSERINKLLSIPKIELKEDDIENDERLKSILER